MKKVIITKGLPGSGKSTYAKDLIRKEPGKYKRVNKDDLRAMLDDSHFSRKNEELVLSIRNSIILDSLDNGFHVIVDDTNLNPIHENRIIKLVTGIAEVEIMDFTDVSVDTCIKRDLGRAKSVGESVIRKMYNTFLRKRKVYVKNTNLPKAIIVDIDGTLARMHNRGPFEWSRVGEDHCNETIKNIANSFDGEVVLVSGRDSICRPETEEWLQKNDIKYTRLLMRPQGNYEKDSIVKENIFEYYIRDYFCIEYVLDDRNQVVEMWRNLGLTCLQVEEGDF